MDNGDKGQDGENVSPIMTLPEDAIREIFNYLSFQTLYFSLRTVCKNIQIYVDNYLKVRKGISLFVGCQKGSEKEVIEITELRNKGFIIIRTPASSIPWVTSILQNNKFFNEGLDRLLDLVLYKALYQMSVCFINESDKKLLFRYFLKSKKLEKFSINGTKLEWLDPNETSYAFLQRLVSRIIPYQFETQCYGNGHYPFVLFKTKGKTWSVGKMMSYK